MSADLQNEFIADTYTSLLHLSGGDLNKTPKRDVYDGAGNVTGLALSGTKVITNNVALPEQHVDSLEATNNEITNLVDMFFPVGTIQMTCEPNDNPGNRIPGTTWERVAEGRFVVGVGGENPSKDYSEYAVGDNDGGMGPNHDGKTSHVALIEEQMPRHTHAPDSENSEYGNVVSWTSGPFPPDDRTSGGVGQLIQQGTSTYDPVYGFPAFQPIAQTLSFAGGKDGGAAQAFSISPISYGAYIWKRTQ